MNKDLAGISWNALLQKAEEVIGKFEEEDYYSRDEPMTNIEAVRGSEHAYYDEEKKKQLEEMGKLLEECDCLMEGDR